MKPVLGFDSLLLSCFWMSVQTDPRCSFPLYWLEEKTHKSPTIGYCTGQQHRPYPPWHLSTLKFTYNQNLYTFEHKLNSRLKLAARSAQIFSVSLISDFSNFRHNKFSSSIIMTSDPGSDPQTLNSAIFHKTFSWVAMFPRTAILIFFSHDILSAYLMTVEPDHLRPIEYNN